MLGGLVSFGIKEVDSQVKCPEFKSSEVGIADNARNVTPTYHHPLTITRSIKLQPQSQARPAPQESVATSRDGSVTKMSFRIKITKTAYNKTGS